MTDRELGHLYDLAEKLDHDVRTPGYGMKFFKSDIKVLRDCVIRVINEELEKKKPITNSQEDAKAILYNLKMMFRVKAATGSNHLTLPLTEVQGYLIQMLLEQEIGEKIEGATSERKE